MRVPFLLSDFYFYVSKLVRKVPRCSGLANSMYFYVSKLVRKVSRCSGLANSMLTNILNKIQYNKHFMTEPFEGTGDDRSLQFIKFIHEAPLAFSMCLYFSDLWAQVQGTGIQDRVVGSRSQSHTRMSTRPFYVEHPPSPRQTWWGSWNMDKRASPHSLWKLGNQY